MINYHVALCGKRADGFFWVHSAVRDTDGDQSSKTERADVAGLGLRLARLREPCALADMFAAHRHPDVSPGEEDLRHDIHANASMCWRGDQVTLPVSAAASLAAHASVTAPRSIKASRGERDPEMRQTRKSEDRRFGIKADVVRIGMASRAA